jgi:predicted dehydrogenase
MSNQEQVRKTTRRGFLKKTTALAGAAVTFPAIIPASALGREGATAPSNRIVMGCVGVGGQGTGNMRGFLGFKEVQVVAVCDVDRAHRDRATALVNARYEDQGCGDYNDFRALLARDDLDCISIGTPDHWHAIPAIASAKRGLDIYGEKPLSLTIPQGRAMADAVRRYGVVWQTGSWQRSQRQFRLACELVRNGRIGPIHRVEVGLPSGSSCAVQPEMPIPEGFDYDFWLGPAPVAPYTEKRCHGNFRWILDYSGGQLTDWAAHHCDIANWGMGTEYTGPTSVEGRGEYPREGLWNTATSYAFECEFAADASPVAPKGFVMSVSNSHRSGTTFIGADGWVSVSRQHLETSPEDLKNSIIGRDEIHLYESRNHAKNFFDCMRTRQETVTPIEVAHRAISIAHLGNIAMKLERKVHWDPKAERFINDDAANRKLDRAMRGHWHL